LFLTHLLDQKSFLPRVLKRIGVVSLLEKLRSANLSKEAMGCETRKNLISDYMKDIKKLEKLLNRDLSIWYKEGAK